ncbi:hypothetical protein BJ944DRAFT_229009 [Cunninghamella echinulata]|nr:hypothetical protein BJ944DRAFT_229009 [Cunninghamella echinulata]
MDKKINNTPDAQEDLPPTYQESSSTQPAYDDRIVDSAQNISPYNPNYSPQQQQQQQQKSNQNPSYQTIVITTSSPSPTRAIHEQERIRLLNTNERPDHAFPLAALFFIFGWFCPILFFIGACCCVGHRNPYEAWWGKLNLIMSIAFLMTSIIYSIVAILTGNWFIF